MNVYSFLLAGLALLLITSCQPSQKKRIIGLWQETSVKNPEMDSAYDQQRMFLDTVGSQTDSLANFRLYGTNNIDTFKKYQRANLDAFKEAQEKAISETWFDFHPDSMVYLHSLDGLDSAKWYFEDQALILDEQKLKGGGSRIRMEVLNLNDTLLTLHFREKYLNSITSFRRVKR
ncbi:MAG: hypothetical protein JST06_10675 [Bacteroidetes bacterium]|nr:hypothetical protein [Bacteroidota bacterium]MBS1629500.1 hypothetical protein [Bacteroidota bacterium]